ncbi:MAG: ferrous iron transport protein A [Bacilli bacterium]|nr:ferrous iron transport protein A [Bacilli bacterium]
MNITDLQKGETAQVVSLHKIDVDFMKRLLDLGIYVNASVLLLRKLSYNRLYLVEVDDIEICLRQEDASLIEVVK